MALFPVEADEAYELYEADEADEAARRRWPPPRVATGQGLFRPRPQTQYVTQAQLQAALARVSAQERTNANAIRQIGSRVSTAAAAVSKETSDRKKETGKIKSNLSQTQQMAAILPLLTQPKSIKDTDVGSSLTGQQVLVDGSNTLGLLLPMLLLTSVGDGGGGLFGGSGDSSMLMMLALVLATQKSS
jgi:hypothetical protein